jgi:hypothetical protein
MDNATVTSLTWHTPAEGSQGRQVGIVLLSVFGQFRPELLMLYVPASEAKRYPHRLGELRIQQQYTSYICAQPRLGSLQEGTRMQEWGTPIPTLSRRSQMA